MGEPKFGEPWTDNDDGTILGQTGYLRSPYESLRARVIACVNALAGIDHPEALPALLETVRRAVAAHIGCGLGIAYRALFDEAPKAKEELK